MVVRPSQMLGVLAAPEHSSLLVPGVEDAPVRAAQRLGGYAAESSPSKLSAHRLIGLLVAFTCRPATSSRSVWTQASGSPGPE